MFNLREFLGLAYYTSRLDQFLKAFNQKNPQLSASQQKEADKYKRICQLRDNTHPSEPKKTFWDKF